MPVINFVAGENTGGSWEPLPEGNQTFGVESVEVTVSKKGNQQIEISMKILDGDRAGKTAKNWYSLTPQAGWNLRGLLDALGIEYSVNGQDGEGRDDLVFDTDDLIGRRVEYYVKQRSYEGRMNNDFTNPKDPDYTEEEDAGKQQAAPPKPAPAPAPQANGNGGRRRPRPSR